MKYEIRVECTPEETVELMKAFFKILGTLYGVPVEGQ